MNLSHRLSFFRDKNKITLLFLCVVSVFFSWIMLPFGPGISNDSLLYLECANHLFSGKGFTVVGHEGNLAFASDRFPLYPLLLKFFSLCGIQPVAFHILLFISFAFLWIRILLSFSSGNNLLLVFSFASLSLLFPFILVYYNLWTEGIYLILLLLFILVLNSGKKIPVLLLLLALLSLTRMVGITVGISMALTWVVYKEYSKAVTAFCFSILPVAAWMLAGFLFNAEISRHLSNHWLAPLMVIQFIEMMGSLASTNSTSQIILGIMIFVLPALTYFKFFSHRNSRDKMLLFLIILFYVYPFFLFFSISFIDYSTPIDYRILAPQFLILLLIFSKVLLKNNASSYRKFVPLILLTAFYFFLHAKEYSNLRENGYGFNSKESQRFMFTKVIETLPKDCKWYSNMTHGVYYLTGKISHELPLKFDIHDNRLNPDYETEWQRTLRELRDSSGIIVWIRSGAFEKSFISYEDLKNTNELYVIYDDWLCLVMGTDDPLKKEK